MTLENIPQEMRPYSQWVRYDANKRPLNPNTGALASVTDPTTWGTWNEVNKSSHGVGIGFVFTDNDPFTGIDLDVAENEAPSEEQQTILREFDSYAELSPSGRGLHIIVKGKIPSSKRKKGIEVYSSGRYFTMTGNAIHHIPISEKNDKLNRLWAHMNGNTSLHVQDAPNNLQVASDEEIVNRARNAANRNKFAALYAGNWQDNYPSQSEADQALINIIQFYTKNHEQIARIFRASNLGKRDKAKRDDYVANMIAKAFDRELKPIAINLPNPFIKTEEETPTLNLSELLHLASTEPETEFTTEYLTPLGDLTLLSANGGVGKTFLALIWLLCIAAGRVFMGLKVSQSPVLFVTAEDREKECAKRLAVICGDMQLLMQNQFTQEAHNNFNLWEILGKPLWVEDRANASGVPTLAMMELEKRIDTTNARQVVIDNASSIFCANHNDNVQVTAFITYLRRMAERTQCNILILAHVSADNATKGATKTYYGSTAWHNAVRSRLFMELKPAKDGINEHIIVIHEKSNYGKLAEPFKLHRNPENGILRLLSNYEIAQAIDENISNIAEQVYLDIKAVFDEGDYIVATDRGSTNFYSCLSNYFPKKYRDGDRKRKQEVKVAIQRLADEKRVRKQTRLTGSRNTTTIWVPALPTTEGNQ